MLMRIIASIGTIGLCMMILGILCHVLLSFEAFSHTDIVISRYKESVEYLKNPIFQSFRKIHLYNKGPILEIDWTFPENITVLTLPNVGCEGHTYLHHIIHNQDGLADKTLFLPASWFENARKKEITQLLLQSLYSHDFAALGVHNTTQSLYEEFENYSLESYQHNHIHNRHPSSLLKPCPDGPFGVWYEKNFGNRRSHLTTYNGIFFTSEAKIRANDLELYKDLIAYLDQDRNPEAGHFMERSWAVLFMPDPIEPMTH